METLSQIRIGVDIGGTSIKIGLVEDTGAILEKWEIPTNQAGTSEIIVNEICDSIGAKLEKYGWTFRDAAGIGVGAPGFVDGKTGFVYEAVNIAGWRNVPLGELFTKRTGLPVFVENDANAAALGENWVGAGNQAENMVAVTLGTGVGGGIIANGKILDGVNGTAGEIGHITIDPHGYPCNCGRRGCLETITSATGIARQAMENIAKDPDSGLAEYYRMNGGVTAKVVFSRAAQGDANCQEIVEHTTDVLGKALANLAIIVNPSCMVIGGGVSKSRDQLLQPLKHAFSKYALPRVSEVCEIKLAQLGNDAGLIGAASLVKTSN